MIKLSPRLQIVYDMIPQCHSMADVGCDHGYLTIAALENNKADFAISMDVNKGPLNRAKDNIEAEGLSDKASFRLSDGLRELHPGEAEVICICGMGGALIKRIIKNDLSIAKSVEALIIEPQSEYFELRDFLKNEGFVIIDEELTMEENKIYPIIKLCYEQDVNKRPTYSAADLTYGPVIIKKVPELLKILLDKNKSEYSTILCGLEEIQPKSDAIKNRQEELKRELQIISEIENLL